MKKILFIAFLVVAFNGIAQSFTTVKVGEEQKISLKIPDEFISMTDQERMKKVYSTKVPLAMYADQSREITLGINYNIMQWTEEDTDLVYGFYKASINNLFDTTIFMTDEIRQINGRDFLIFEFTGTIENDNAFSAKNAQKNYSYIAYTSWKDQVLLFNFSCKARYMNQWREIAKTIMESIKIKG